MPTAAEEAVLCVTAAAARESLQWDKLRAPQWPAICLFCHMPCTMQSYGFQLDNANPFAGTPPRERYVGLTNRVVGGLLMHQVRIVKSHVWGKVRVETAKLEGCFALRARHTPDWIALRARHTPD